MKNFLVFNNKGYCVGKISKAELHIEEINPNLIYKEDDRDPKKTFLKEGLVIDITNNDAILSGNVISNIDLPASIESRFGVYILEDTSVTLNFQYKGSYIVNLKSLGHFDKKFEITQ